MELRYRNLQSDDENIRFVRCPGLFKLKENGEIVLQGMNNKLLPG